MFLKPKSRLKRVIIVIIISGLIFPFLSGLPVKAEENEPIESNDMLHFVMQVKWGNVRGVPVHREKSVFDGSISLSSDTGRISLIRTLLFEKHDGEHDKIITKSPTVSWKSYIYNHWDGVKVLVSGNASSTLTVDVTQGKLEKTVKEYYESRKPIIQDVGQGKEIVVKVFPLRKRVFLLKTLWGGSPRTPVRASINIKHIKDVLTSKLQDKKIDFSGYLKINGGGTIGLIRTIRFEPRQGDEIINRSLSQIDWHSYIYGGWDGVLVKVKLNKKVADDNTITVSFTSDEINWEQSFSIIDLYHNRITRVSVPVGDSNYTLILAVKRHPNRRLIKLKNRAAVYMIEDDTKRPILSAEIFEANGLKWSDIEIVDEEEFDSYPTSEALNYPDGTLVKGSGPAVYVISEGRKRAFRSARAFLRLGYKWKNIKRIKDAELDNYETGEIITEESSHPEGALIRVKNTPGVYLVKGGKIRPITSRQIFEANKFKWDHVLEVTPVQKNKFILGKALVYPDGTLVKAKGPGVYIIDKGVKRPFRSAKDFLSLKNHWKSIKTISNTELNQYSTGDEMIGDDISSSGE